MPLHYLEKSEEMRNRFLRGYSPPCVDKALHLALGKPRAELLQKKDPLELKNTTTYTLNLRKVGDAGMFYRRTQLCLLNLRIHHLLYVGEVAIYPINWSIQLPATQENEPGSFTPAWGW